ncbi:DUF2971 domain-containing protein [Microbulbifer variabilis]|uniref:DUF2971 domain-containing protein n=1 Tax=Microbulbifer variabilis TaxID=266805 RepID=A0ABY4VAN5_9GAMM|nr:DUF2971 domain-containing protein [Microbulbifer variabilis]USD19935.1 DUF2971 domain-containing protein [Microbulbifer variabilis]
MAVSLYKYMTWNASYEFFLQPKLRFTQPSQFNDPFEGQASAQSMLELTQSMQPKAQYGGVFQQLIQNLQTATESPNLIYPEYAILCLASCEQNLLMWAHYAENHTGFMIELDSSHLFFQDWYSYKKVVRPTDQLLGRIHDVAYSSQRAKIPQGQSSIKSLLVKGEEWSYEEEYRMFLRREDADFHNLASCEESDPNHESCILLYQIPPEAIKRVVIGCRAGSRKQEIVDQLNQAFKLGVINPGSIQVQEAVIDPNLFRLNYRDLSIQASAPINNTYSSAVNAGKDWFFSPHLDS